MKQYLKKNDNDFKTKFLSKINEFNNVIYELKDKTEKLLKDKIDQNEKTIKAHELECKPQIDDLKLEVQKWKEKADSVTSQMTIKEGMIKNLEETIQRKNEDRTKY